MAQSVGAAESTDFFSAEELESPKECPGYDIKQSDGGYRIPLHHHRSQVHSGPKW